MANKTLRTRYAIGRVRVDGVRMTGTKSAVVDYTELTPDGDALSTGTAMCFDVDAVELDDDDDREDDDPHLEEERQDDLRGRD